MSGSNKDPNMPESIHPPASVIVYICPTPGCENHHASPDFRPDRTDVESMQYHRSQNDGSRVASHPRVECPECRSRDGKHVNRIPYVVTQVVPLKAVMQYNKLQEEKAKKRAEAAEQTPAAV